MRRPILLPVFSLVVGMTIVAIIGEKFTGILSGVILIFLVIPIFFLFKKTDLKDKIVPLRKGIVCVLIFLAIGMTLFNHELNRTYVLNDFNGKTVTLNGTVIFSENKGKDVYYLTLLVREGQGLVLENPEKALIRVYGPLLNFQDLVGRDIQIRGPLEIPSGARNPKCFDYQKYLKTKKIGSIVNVNPRFIEDRGWQEGLFSTRWRILNKISLVKQDFIDSLSKKIPEEEMDLVKGMLFGDKTDIDSEVLVEFQRNSTGHILAVSGLHVGMIYGLLLLIFRKRNSFTIDLVIMTLLSIYAIMSLLAPSVIRAVFMIGLHIVSKRFHFRYDLLSATVFTGGVILLFNPLMLLNAGFQLSYIALLAMSFLIPFFKHWWSSLFLRPFLPLIAIQIGLIPIIAFHFNHLSFIGIIANIPTIFLAGLIIPLLIIMFPLYFLMNGLLMDILATSTKWLIEVLVFVNETLYFQGKCSSMIPSPPFWAMLFFYCGLFFLTSELVYLWIERKKVIKIITSFIVILCLCILGGQLEEDDFQDMGIIFIDVGQGDCLFIESPTGKTAMIDSGGSARYDVGRKTLLPFLLKNGHKELDLAIVTHLHQDHYGGFKTISQEIPVGGLVLYEGYESEKASILSESGFEAGELIFARKGDSIKLDDRVSIEIIYPPAWGEDDKYRPEDENQMSLVLMVVYDGIRILMTGDIDQDGEKDLIRVLDNMNDLHCDILKVPHHGSKYSMGESFIETANPKCAVIQVGKNNFGHPSSSVLEKCLERDIIVFRNDLQGAIGVEVNSRETDNLWIKTMITSEF